MHDVLVSQRTNALHGHQGAEQYGEIEQHGTVRVMAKEGARLPAAQGFFHVGVTGSRPFPDEAIVMFLPLTCSALRRMVRDAILPSSTGDLPWTVAPVACDRPAWRASPAVFCPVWPLWQDGGFL
jgi:hypothetical protein